jgi:hypothetical protein
LQLDRVGARIFGGVNNANGLIEVLIMIGGKLGNNVNRLAASNLTARKFERLGKLCFYQNFLRCLFFRLLSG